jgi:hypothetical protein
MKGGSRSDPPFLFFSIAHDGYACVPFLDRAQRLRLCAALSAAF